MRHTIRKPLYSRNITAHSFFPDAVLRSCYTPPWTRTKARRGTTTQSPPSSRDSPGRGKTGRIQEAINKHVVYGTRFTDRLLLLHDAYFASLALILDGHAVRFKRNTLVRNQIFVKWENKKCFLIWDLVLISYELQSVFFTQLQGLEDDIMGSSIGLHGQ